MSTCSNPAGVFTRDRARVLVIDDDPIFRSLLVSVLRRDYLVSVASEGAEGYHKAIEFPPEVVIVDIQMPGWDGLKTIKAFRAHAVLSRVGIVVLSADASRDTVLAAIQAGAHEYIIKASFSREDFLQKLSRMRARLHAGGLSATAADSVGLVTAPAVGDVVPNAEGLANLQAVIDAWE
jgi:DNA-binding NarL/FixJ family response regulator